MLIHVCMYVCMYVVTLTRSVAPYETISKRSHVTPEQKEIQGVVCKYVCMYVCMYECRHSISIEEVQ